MTLAQDCTLGRQPLLYRFRFPAQLLQIVGLRVLLRQNINLLFLGVERIPLTDEQSVAAVKDGPLYMLCGGEKQSFDKQLIIVGLAGDRMLTGMRKSRLCLSWALR